MEEKVNKETLYLDTSVVSAYYDTRAEERQEATIMFWKETLPRYQGFVFDFLEFRAFG